MGKSFLTKLVLSKQVLIIFFFISLLSIPQKGNCADLLKSEEYLMTKATGIFNTLASSRKYSDTSSLTITTNINGTVTNYQHIKYIFWKYFVVDATKLPLVVLNELEEAQKNPENFTQGNNGVMLQLINKNYYKSRSNQYISYIFTNDISSIAVQVNDP